MAGHERPTLFAAGGLKAPGGGDRAEPLDAVLRKLPAFRQRYGITRIAETTRLDRIGIPTMSAFVPRSADVLGVYSGKGRSRDEALVSAVMEAVERQVCAAYEPPTTALLPHEIARDFDLDQVGFAGPADEAVRCVPAVNLLTGQPMFVPLGVVNPFVERLQFGHWTTNGLAAGSSVVEALLHALFEVVERHQWSETEIAARVWPDFIRTVLPGHDGSEGAHVPDAAVALEIALPSGDGEIDILHDAIRGAGIALRLFMLAEDRWPAAAFACLYEPNSVLPMVHAGTSSSWSPRRAAIAAITEAVSSRSIAIQGAREDLIRANAPQRGSFRHGRRLERLPAGRWYFDVPAPFVTLDAIADRASCDLGADVRRLLDVIRSAGVACVAMVDLSPSDGSVHVVRVVAPGLERFTLDGSLTKRTRSRLAMSFDSA